MNKAKPRVFKHQDSAMPLSIAVAYIVGGYAGGWYLVSTAGWPGYAAGVLLLAHSMVIAAYLMHECAHNSLFAKNGHNERLGKFLNAVCGSNYGAYDEIRSKHMRHHIDNCDTLYLDYRPILKRHPLLLKAVQVLEWFYIPAVELLMHGLQLAIPFIIPEKKNKRIKVISILLLRGTLLACIAWLNPYSLAGYAIAYLIFLTVLRFMDNFQHDYEFFFRLGDDSFIPPMKGNAVYEQTHTYTNLLSRRWPILNLLVLNFCYHNAHHERPTLPWFKLPKLHQEMSVEQSGQQLSFWMQCKSFHRQRVARVLSEEYGEEHVLTQIRAGKAVGVNGVSFLTAF
jgi:fatty acid desaturase